ncbi:MAG: hypothetical protein LBG57_02720 [Treponema sp.]|nr:hypothetical protein [Treponema sp.]
MAVEIELKVRLDDPEPVKQKLSSLGTYCRSYKKNDTYWAAGRGFGENAADGSPSSEVRVRREIDTEADGRVLKSTLVTYKIKEIRAGIEINDEREFTVSGEGSGEAGGDAFEGLLSRLGLRPFIRKEKQGQAWTLGACGTCGFLRPLTAKTPDFWAPLRVCKVENAQNCAFSLSFGLKPHRLLGEAPVLAELSMVKDLGWFLELEILAEKKDERIIAESRNRLLSLLETLAIPPERIESRPYTEMLKSLN